MHYPIRLARSSDIPQLIDIERSAAQLFGEIPQYAWLATAEVQSAETHLGFISQDSCWVAVNSDDHPVGFIDVAPLDNGLHISELSVHQQWQRQGIGRLLIMQVISYALKKHYAEITLTTFRQVPWNAPYYQRFGFEILMPAELSPKLQALHQKEIAMGFSAECRCVMRMKSHLPNESLSI